MKSKDDQRDLKDILKFQENYNKLPSQGMTNKNIKVSTHIACHRMVDINQIQLFLVVESIWDSIVASVTKKFY